MLLQYSYSCLSRAQSPRPPSPPITVLPPVVSLNARIKFYMWNVTFNPAMVAPLKDDVGICRARLCMRHPQHTHTHTHTHRGVSCLAPCLGPCSCIHCIYLFTVRTACRVSRWPICLMPAMLRCSIWWSTEHTNTLPAALQFTSFQATYC
jgi:hypothetical protein